MDRERDERMAADVLSFVDLSVQLSMAAVVFPYLTSLIPYCQSNSPAPKYHFPTCIPRYVILKIILRWCLIR